MTKPKKQLLTSDTPFVPADTPLLPGDTPLLPADTPLMPVETTLAERLRARSGKRRSPVLAGWREWAVLSLATETPIRAKLDTGAQSSAVHASNILESEDEDGKLFASFDIHIDEDRSRTTSIERHPVIGSRMVLSSSGHWSARPVVAVDLQLGDATFETELTLAARNEMEFRLLIGRAALRKRFVVDPSQSFALGELDPTGTDEI